jgi:hypothetical protein
MLKSKADQLSPKRKKPGSKAGLFVTFVTNQIMTEVKSD